MCVRVNALASISRTATPHPPTHQQPPHLCVSRLLQSPAARVVSVSSMGHKMGGLDLDDLNFERRRYNSWVAYGQSKLANILFAKELARR